VVASCPCGQTALRKRTNILKMSVSPMDGKAMNGSIDRPCVRSCPPHPGAIHARVSNCCW
jgi:hypothetical protein